MDKDALGKPVLALYDFRSKQNYIYRTNKIREISGASTLIAEMFKIMLSEAVSHGFEIEGREGTDTDWRSSRFSYEACLAAFDAKDSGLDGLDASVIYVGGGNLRLLVRNRDAYLRMNRLFSRVIREQAYSLSLIASCVTVTGDFKADQKKLYEANAKSKNTGYIGVPCNVLPFTQVDRVTFQPLSDIDRHDGKISHESQLKRNAYGHGADKSYVLGCEDLDAMVTDKGSDSLLAVIYVDGNSIGSRLEHITEGLTGYDECVAALRDFSIELNKVFVQDTMQAIHDYLNDTRFVEDGSLRKYSRARRIISGGDEITIICNAHVVPGIVRAYLNALEATNKNNEGRPYRACIGIALFHSHDPFATVYSIAEECCESGKKANRKDQLPLSSGGQGLPDGCYIDFHYCRSGITGSLDDIRGAQEEFVTNRPYRVGFSDSCQNGSSRYFEQFIELGRLFALSSKVTRADVKALGEAAFAGGSRFVVELERIRAKAGTSFFGKFISSSCGLEGDEMDAFRRMVFDVASVYDVWFSVPGLLESLSNNSFDGECR